ncbi:hypothetical protein N7467_007513 [Penicillium canescens]|nr:hypothetical protein N7467_007513 [Penicillium canescens]
MDCTEWAKGVFDRALAWSASSSSGIAKAADCILFQIRDMSGVLEEWQLDQAGLKAYSRWEKSTEDGFAAAVDTVLRIEREGEHLVKHIFKKGAISPHR